MLYITSQQRTDKEAEWTTHLGNCSWNMPLAIWKASETAGETILKELTYGNDTGG